MSWCQTSEARIHPAYSALCEPWDTNFGTQRYHISSSSTSPFIADPSNHLKHSTVAGTALSEPFCDILGARQRNWLTKSLSSSTALLNIVVAPGGLLGNPVTVGSRGCTGSEWDCFRPAQVNLLHTLANATGCTVVLSGVLLSSVSVHPSCTFLGTRPR
jgi:alkaline phosphatase D